MRWALQSSAGSFGHRARWGTTTCLTPEGEADGTWDRPPPAPEDAPLWRFNRCHQPRRADSGQTQALSFQKLTDPASVRGRMCLGKKSSKTHYEVTCSAMRWILTLSDKSFFCLQTWQGIMSLNNQQVERQGAGDSPGSLNRKTWGDSGALGKSESNGVHSAFGHRMLGLCFRRSCT